MSKTDATTKTIKVSSMNQIGAGESVMKNSIVRFVKGGAVGFFASAVLQPLQVIKTSMQITPVELAKNAEPTKVASVVSKAAEAATLKSQAAALPKEVIKKAKVYDTYSFREATEHIWKTEGPKGYLRGLGPSLIKNTLLTG